MKHKGPIITLFAGLLFAGVLFALNVNVNNDAAKDAAARNAAANATASGGAQGGSSPAVEATKPQAPPQSPAGEGKATYAGKVEGGAAGLAIAINNGRAVAYVCDGKSVEAWLDGSGTGGQLDLQGAKGTLVATYANGVATGTVTAGSKKWRFTIKIAQPPSGLYRLAASVRDRAEVAWAVTPEGTFGIQWDKGNPRPAPAPDTTNNTATIDGATLPIEPANP
jgi:hypothetical protein